VTSFSVLGPLRVALADGTEVALPGALQRRLLLGLLLHRGRAVSVDRLAEMVWPGGDAPGPAALQSLVFRVRQRVPGIQIEHRPSGYVLQVGEADLDVDEFERRLWAATADKDRDPSTTVASLDSALSLWRGDPFEDLVDTDDGRVEIERLHELRRRAIEERFELMVALGRAEDVLPDLQAFVAREPLREHPRRALMDAYAATGRRADALRVFDAYRRDLADQLGVAPSAELRAKHDALLREDEGVASTEPAGHHPPRPRPTSTFVGRDELLANLAARLERARLVTLIGPGGVGKTRLALEAMNRLAPSFADDVAFCDLTTAGPVPVVNVVIGALGVEERAGQDELSRLANVLRHRRCLLVFDNCEHVIDEAATLAERLIGLTERLAIIASSRERLAVDGEQLLVVPPLPIGTDDETSPALQLLLDRANAVREFVPDAAETELANELCRRLDGLPLAIELAAARLQTLSLQEVMDGLDHSLAVLRGGRRTVERHRSVEAALEWSYAMMSGDERRTLQAAALFASRFDAADVAAVLGLSVAETRDQLAALSERSMAHRDGSSFYLLDIVRRFAFGEIDPGALPSLRLRHAQRMRDKAHDLGARLRTAGDAWPVEEFRRVLPDLRAAVTTALELDDAALALSTLVALRDLSLNAMSPEPMRWAADAAEAGERVDHPLAVDGYAMAAFGAWKRSDLNETRHLLARADAVAERLHIGDNYELLGTHGTEHLAHGRLAEAIDAYRRAAQLAEATDDPLRQGETLATIAICMSYAHDPDAVGTADRVIRDVLPTGGAVVAAWCWYAAGECRLDSDPSTARIHLEQAVAAARTGGSSFVEGVAGASLASLDVRSGNIAEAIANYRTLLPLWLRAGVRSPFWTAMRAVADLLTQAGESESAARLLGAVLSPSSGHAVFGDDDERLSTIRAVLRDQLGATTLDRLLATGAEMDDAAAAEVAAAAFDRLG
jgi:predicted ATPase/DNA-binding SARP family transcriptional activator